MNNGLETRYFLSALTGAGYYALHRQFLRPPERYFCILKGGPGCGKSTFLKRVGDAGRAAGLAVVRLHCAGDPASLDGVYFPEKRSGFFDGTAPHTVDPALFGASGEYLDLGTFCRTEALDTARARRPVRAGRSLLSRPAHSVAHAGGARTVARRGLPRRNAGRRARIRALNADCAMFRLRAQQYLTAVAALDARATPGLVYPEDREAARRRAKSICTREFGTPGKGSEPGRCERLFLSAITCEGRIFFPETIAAHCARVYLLDDGCGLAEEFLRIVRAHAVRCGLDVLSCPDPLIPSRTQAVLVPSRGVGFLAGTPDDVPEGLTQRHIRLDVLPDPVRQRALRRTMRSDTRQQQLALASAVEQLRMANLLHNELEAVYRPCMDFAALTTFTDRYLRTFPGT